MKIKKLGSKNLKVAVLGLGKSGIAAANLAVKKGFKVFASDSGKQKTHKQMGLNKAVCYEFGKHTNKLLEADIIIKSPGLPVDLPILKLAKKKKIPVMSELDFALNFIKCKKIIAVTGTNGKTTTTTLIYKIIKKEFKNTVVAGNIGYPISSVVGKIKSDTVLVLELSSYQLEDSPTFKPYISVSLNITPDHLKHHKTMKNYIKAKSNIFINQTNKNFAVYNKADKYLKKEILKTKAKKIAFNDKSKNSISYDNGTIIININNKLFKFNVDIKIPGRHNIDNILAAVVSAYLSGVKIKNIQTVINSFKGVEHRIEFVRNLRGVKYYNDSKGTNVDSTKVALEAFDKNIHLILGGQDKGSSYMPLFKLIKEKVKNIILIGEATPIIKKELKSSAVMYEAETLFNAIKILQKFVKSGDIVLFSPACASFDQFKDFEDRGRVFKQIVSALK